MRTLFFPLICFSVIIPLGIIFSSFSEYMTNIFRSLTSLMILISLILFFFKTNNLKRGIVPLMFMFYIVCFALVTIFFVEQMFGFMFFTPFLLMICPVFFFLFLASILIILTNSIFQTHNIFSRIIFMIEFLLLLFWGGLLITQGHNIQNSLNIFVISFSVLLAAISFSVKYAH